MFFRRFQPPRDGGGQGVVEYAFILALVSLVTIGIMSFLGQTLVDQFCLINFELSRTGRGDGPGRSGLIGGKNGRGEDLVWQGGGIFEGADVIGNTLGAGPAL